jgi:hypothetical protein
MDYETFARQLKAQIDTLATDATDATASKVPSLYPTLTKSGALIKAGTRIRWGDALKIAAYDTYDREDTDPDHDTNGWTALSYHSGYRDIPDTMSTTNMFKKDEIGWRGGKFWQSLIDNNSWTPEAYAQGWKEVVV